MRVRPIVTHFSIPAGDVEPLDGNVCALHSQHSHCILTMQHHVSRRLRAQRHIPSDAESLAEQVLAGGNQDGMIVTRKRRLKLRGGGHKVPAWAQRW